MDNNFFVKGGLSFDRHESLKKEENAVWYIRNGDLTDSTNAGQNAFVQNALSNELCANYPPGAEFRGTIKLDKNYHIVFFRETHESSIYLLDDSLNALTKLVSSPCLDFKNQVTGVFRYKGNDRIIYFVENGKDPRYLNIDKPYPTERANPCSDCDQIDLNVLDCDKLKIFPDYVFPKIEIETIEGNIPDGVYQFAIKLDNSEFYILENTFNVHSLYGNKERFGFTLEIDCIDESVSEYQIAMITQREDRGTVAQIVGTYSSESRSVIITELDAPYYKPIDIEQLFLSYPKYISAEHIATNSEHLIMGGLEEDVEINYQPLANEITSEVVVTKVPADRAHLYPTFMGDENYAVYIQHVIGGKHTSWYHVPSKVELKKEWDEIVKNDDVWTETCDPELKKYWEVYNTAELISVKEENDNGSTDADKPLVFNPNCKKYKINTRSKYWPVSVRYKDCSQVATTIDDYEVWNTAYGLAKDIEICTLPQYVGDIEITFYPFNKQLDIKRNGAKGQCVPNMAPLDPPVLCSQFLLDSRYAADPGDINYGIVQYSSCTQTVDPGNNTIVDEICENPIVVFSGDITPLTMVPFCACDSIYNEDSIPFDISILPDPDTTIQLIGPCFEVPEPEDNSKDGELCDFKVVARSKFAYWESGIKYPDTPAFENLTGKRCDVGIKHHKFPDRTQVKEGKRFPHIHNNTANCGSKEYVYPMAIQLKNVQPPVDCKGDPIKHWQGYRIGIARRNNYKSILHKGIINNMRTEILQDCTESFYANYPFNDLNVDPLLQSKELLYLSGLSGTFRPKGSVTGTYSPMSLYSKKKFQYISPNIQYVQNDNTATELITYCEENGYIDGRINETKEFHKAVLLEDAVYNIIAGLTLAAVVLEIIPLVAGGADAFGFINSSLNIVRNFSDGNNYAYNVVEKSKYTKRNWTNIIENNRRRKINVSQFLNPINQYAGGFKVNNFNREGGLFLDLNKDLTNPSVVEKSRVHHKDVNSMIIKDCTQKDLKTSSYYVGLKRNLPNQYGRLTDPLVRPVSNIINTTTTPILFGGDVWITKHSSIKKFPFFTNLPIGLPFDSSFATSPEINVGFPTYWMDLVDRNELRNFILNNTVGRLATSVLFNTTTNHYNIDTSIGTLRKSSCGFSTSRSSKWGTVDGGFYTHVTGVLEYYCESEYIGPYRETNELPQSNYFPVRDFNDFQAYEYVTVPEQFRYNIQQRNLGISSKNAHSNPKIDCCNLSTISSDKIIFSLESDPYSKKDKWLTFLPNNYHQFLHQDGKLTTIHSVDNHNLLFLFDNAAYISQVSVGVFTDKGIQYLGQGSIFQNRLKKISNEETGFGGCIDKHAVVNTPFGVFWPDRNRKRFISYTDKMKDLSMNMESWFNENMTTGLIGTYDSFSKNIYWTAKDWTVSYKPLLGDYVSFHDFLPKWYTRTVNNFLTFDKEGIWKHNVKNNYQTYFGKKYPFEVGFTVTNNFHHNPLTSISLFSEFYTNDGYASKIYNPKMFFDSAVLWNDFVSTGFKPLFVKDKENPADYGYQSLKGKPLEVTNVKFNQYNINGFRNIAEGQPLMKWDAHRYKPVNINEKLISENNGLVEGKWFNIIFRSTDTTHKKLVNLALNSDAELRK